MQIYPRVALGSAGGYVVWQDSLADHGKFGISARKIDDAFKVQGEAFTVNLLKAENQVQPRVGILMNGGAMFVWEGGKAGSQDVFGRVFSPEGRPVTGDFIVNTYRRGPQTAPSAAILKDGNAIVAWNSSGQDRSFLGVFGRRLGANGRRLGSEFRLNQYVDLNQKSVELAALPDGGFVAVWVSEGQRSKNSAASERIVRLDRVVFNSVDIYARLFDANGQPRGNEFRVNTDDAVCLAPSVAVSESGFTVVWTVNNRDTDAEMMLQKRSFDFGGSATGEQGALASAAILKGAAISSSGDRYLVCWARPGRKNITDGFFARFLDQSGAVSSEEFSLATNVIGKEMTASLAAKPHGDFFAIWPVYVPGSSFDLFGKSVR